MLVWPEMRPKEMRPRKRRTTLLVIGSDRDGRRIESYCPLLKKWTPVASMDTQGYSSCGTAVMNDCLFVFGGQGGFHSSANVACLHLITMTWTELSPMNDRRQQMSVAVLEGILYAIGGSDGQSILRTVERFDSTTATWKYATSMSAERLAAGAVVLYGRLYVVGGDPGRSHQYMECFNPQTDTWSLKAPMIERREHFGLAAVNGYIFALGGLSTTTDTFFYSVERYDPISDTWAIVSIILQLIFQLLPDHICMLILFHSIALGFQIKSQF